MKKSILVAIFTLSTINAFAGVSTSGGGYAVVCRDKSKSILSTELLDIVEGRLKYKLNMAEASGSAIKDYTQSVENIYFLQTGKPFVDCGLEICNPSKNFSNFLNIVDWVDSKDQLTFVHDIGNASEVIASLEKGCDIEQVAIFNDISGRVQIAKQSWEKMDSLSQAALIQHELVYRESRKFYLLPESTSEHTRLTTALMFSVGLPVTTSDIPENATERTTFHDPNRQLNRQFDATAFWSFNADGPSDQELAQVSNEEYAKLRAKQIFRKQFSYLGGRFVLTKTFVDIPAGVNYGEKYSINSIQFPGWYVLIMPSQSYQNLSGVTIRVFNDKNEAVTDIQ